MSAEQPLGADASGRVGAICVAMTHPLPPEVLISTRRDAALHIAGISLWLNRPGFRGGSDLPPVSFPVSLLSQAVCSVRRVCSNSIGER
jgi:hypothetical protein